MVAHIRETDGQEQTVKAHCQGTAALCSAYASPVGAARIAKLQGILHDAGKLTEAFQSYIRQESDARRGEIDHSYAGAKYLCELAERTNPAVYGEVSRLIAHTILSHHGIHDWLDSDDEDYMAKRLQNADGFTEVTAHLHEIASDAELLTLLEQAAQEYSSLLSSLKDLARQTSDEKQTKIKCLLFGNAGTLSAILSDRCRPYQYRRFHVRQQYRK